MESPLFEAELAILDVMDNPPNVARSLDNLGLAREVLIVGSSGSFWDV